MESAENQAQPQSNKESKLQNPPLSKTETIALLNDSIERLEETIKKIGDNSVNMPLPESINTLLATTKELEAAVTSTEVKVSTPNPAMPPTPQVTANQSRSTNVRGQTAAGNDPRLETKPKTKPKAKPKKNIALTVMVVTAIAIAIVTVFWLWKPQQFANLLPQSEPISAPIVVNPNNPEIDTPIGQPLETPVGVTPDNVDIVRDISAMDFPPEIEPVAEPIEDVVETVIPEELTSGRIQNLKMVTIKPKLNFTPEQSLVAALGTKVSELVETYPQEFIQKVQVDLPASKLLVQVTDDWYSLDEPGQNSLGNEILERSRAFRFQKLELKDNLGTLVARNPIIGENIIILQNSREVQD